MTLKQQLEEEVGRAVEELFDLPTEHDRAVALSLVLRGAGITLEYIKSSGLVGLAASPCEESG